MNEYTGQICPVCNTELSDNSEIVVCTECKIAHHKECWQRNNGCSTFACLMNSSSRNMGAAASADNTKYGNITQNVSSAAGSQACTVCGTYFKGDQMFCTKCGTKRVQVSAAPQQPQAPRMAFCVKCGNKLEPDQMFCTGCGNKVM